MGLLRGVRQTHEVPHLGERNCLEILPIISAPAEFADILDLLSPLGQAVVVHLSRNAVGWDSAFTKQLVVPDLLWNDPLQFAHTD